MSEGKKSATISIEITICIVLIILLALLVTAFEFRSRKISRARQLEFGLLCYQAGYDKGSKTNEN